MNTNDRARFLDRFWPRVKRGDGYAPGACWEWTGHRDKKGYGRFNPKRLFGTRAHIYAYEMSVGGVPAGLVLDHLCRNPACCNPAHLEPVTPRENCLRGIGPTAINFKKSHCKRGHEFTPENTRLFGDGGRHRSCRACGYLSGKHTRETNRDRAREYGRRYAAKKRAAHVAAGLTSDGKQIRRPNSLRVLRVTPGMVKDGTALALVRRAVGGEDGR